MLREFDLKETPELLALLKRIPEGERWGPLIKAERQRVKAISDPGLNGTTPVSGARSRTALGYP